MKNNEQMIPFWQAIQNNARRNRRRREQANAGTHEAMRLRTRNTAQ